MQPFYALCFHSIFIGPVVLPERWRTDGFVDLRPSQITPDLWLQRQVPLPSDRVFVAFVVSASHSRKFNLLVRVRESSGDGSAQSHQQVKEQMKDYVPDVLVFSCENFGLLASRWTGLFLVHFFNQSSINRVSESFLLGTEVPLVFDDSSECASVCGQLL